MYLGADECRQNEKGLKLDSCKDIFPSLILSPFRLAIKIRICSDLNQTILSFNISVVSKIFLMKSACKPLTNLRIVNFEK